MIVVTYAMGTADLAKLGALVHRARSVESLAAATVICFAKAGILIGMHVEVKLLEPPDVQEHLEESRLRQILGVIAQTTSADNLATWAMVEAFEGNWRAAHEEAPLADDAPKPTCSGALANGSGALGSAVRQSRKRKRLPRTLQPRR